MSQGLTKHAKKEHDFTPFDKSREKSCSFEKLRASDYVCT